MPKRSGSTKPTLARWAGALAAHGGPFLFGERFGLADEEHPAVGHPPITRWDYRSFSVYFEYDHVINSVLHHQPHHPLDKDQP